MSTVNAVQDLFQSLKIKYLSSNDWSQVDRSVRRTREGKLAGRIDGVEVKLLPSGHPLAGSYGLFATKRFECCDIVGEYVGVITRDEGPYVLDLHGQGTSDCLGINGEFSGNEMRFMNDFRGLGPEQNVVWKRAYIDTLPRVLVISTKTIEVGEEILTCYGDEFFNVFILNKKERTPLYCADAIITNDSDAQKQSENEKKEGESAAANLGVTSPAVSVPVTTTSISAAADTEMGIMRAASSDVTAANAMDERKGSMPPVSHI